MGDVELLLEKRESELETLKSSVEEKISELEQKDKTIILSKVQNMRGDGGEGKRELSRLPNSRKNLSERLCN